MNNLNLPVIVDTCTWIGNWPFKTLRYNTADALKEKLISQGVKKAFVSHLGSVFSSDPVEFNEFLPNCDKSFFVPVPITDLSRRNWDKIIDFSDMHDIKAIKLLPNYHMYKLEDEAHKLIEYTDKRNIILSIQVRMEDERGQYKQLKVQAVDIKDIASVASKYPEQRFLLNGIYMNELNQIAELENVYIGISSLEGSDIYKSLSEKYNISRFVFESHTPLFYPEGNTFKLGCASISDQEKEHISNKNISKLIYG